MPLYQYKCQECNCIIDKIKKIDDRLNPELSKCFLEEDKECLFEYKISNSSSPIFKGSGFYETDYK